MANITFEQLPEAIGKLLDKLETIEQLLNNQQPSQHSTPDSDLPLTIQQAASFLNLSVATIYGFVSAAKIPHSKKGKRLYFSKIELIAWVQLGRKKTIAEVQREATNPQTAIV